MFEEICKHLDKEIRSVCSRREHEIQLSSYKNWIQIKSANIDDDGMIQVVDELEKNDYIVEILSRNKDGTIDDQTGIVIKCGIEKPDPNKNK